MVVLGDPDNGGEGRGREFKGGDNGPELSDWNDCDLPPIGTVRLFRAESLLQSLVIFFAS